MKLSKKNLKALCRYEVWKNTAPSLTDIAKASWLRYIYVIIILGGCAVFLWWDDQKVIAALFVGYIFGIFYGDFQRFIVLKRFWTIKREVLDWAKIRSIIEANESKKPL